MFMLQQRLKRIKTKLKYWNKSEFGIFLKPKKKWIKSFRISTKLSSRRASLRIGNCK